MRLAATRVKFECDWQPATQFLHALAASAVQSCQFFESKLPEHLFE
jgi:hypothetical protein